VRRLLTHVTGVDYGDRAPDWERWLQARKRLANGQQPSIPPRERVDLSERWTARIGLTSFFSTLIPLDGRIYASSLGAAFDDPADRADGVVRIDGRSGEALLIFEPPEKGPRDILGIAYADNTVFAACRNGFVYALELDGRLRWKSNTGAARRQPRWDRRRRGRHVGRARGGDQRRRQVALEHAD
jgi:outer membrane protein assembly factor BamB